MSDKSHNQFTKESLVELLFQTSMNLGFIPRTKYLKRYGLPHYSTFCNYFEDYNEAVENVQLRAPHLELQEARYTHNKWDRARILVSLKKTLKEIGDIPSESELQFYDLPTTTTFNLHFGHNGYRVALEQIGVSDLFTRKESQFTLSEMECETCGEAFFPRSGRQKKCWRHTSFTCECGSKFSPTRSDQRYCSKKCKELFKKRKLRRKRRIVGLCPQCGSEMSFKRNEKRKHCDKCKLYFSENHQSRIRSSPNG